MNMIDQTQKGATLVLTLEQEIESVLCSLQQRRGSVAHQHASLHAQLRAKMRLPRIVLVAACIGVGFWFVNRTRRDKKPVIVHYGEIPETPKKSHWMSTLLTLVNSVMALQGFLSKSLKPRHNEHENFKK